MSRILEAHSFPIGLFRGVKYEEHSIAMKPGDRLYLYSDGITEAMNINGEQLGKERLIESARGKRRAMVEEWCGAARLADDVSILAVEITQP